MAELDGRQVNRHAPFAVALLEPLAHLPAGFIQHPLADRNDQAGFFRQANETVREHQAVLWVFPTQQGFGTDRQAGLGGELGLVVQAELALLQAVRKSCSNCNCWRALLFIEASKKL